MLIFILFLLTRFISSFSSKIAGNILRITIVLSLLIISFPMLSGCASNTPYTTHTTKGNRPPLHQAVLMGDTQKVSALLQQGDNPNTIDSNGFAAIHFAALTSLGKGAKMIKALISAGANPNTKQQPTNMTPLFFAMNASVAKALIERGADINAKSINQETPLHKAKTAEIVTLLINNGADINAKNSRGQTPKEMFESLIPHLEANPSYVNLLKTTRLIIQALDTSNTQHVSNISGPSKSIKNTFTSTEAVQKSNHALIKERLKRIDRLIANQACKMKDSQWIYTGSFCEKDLAEGHAEAIHKERDWHFKGNIKAGLLVYGVLSENNIDLYEGDFKNGLAHGNGVCFYLNEPEECRYFKGKRIDTLFKQRQEFQRQQSLSSNQKQQPATPIKTAPVQSNTLGDTVQDELIEQGAKFLFDQLF